MVAFVGVSGVAVAARRGPHHAVAARPATVTASTTTTTTLPLDTSTTTVPTPTAPSVRATITTLAPADRIAFLGDSLSVNLGDAARPEGVKFAPPVAIASDGISGCGVAHSGDYRLGGVYHQLSPTCDNWFEEWSAALQRHRPSVVVIQLGRHEVLDRQLDEKWTNILQPAYAAYVRGELARAVGLAGEDGRQVVLLTTPYFNSSSAYRPEDDPARVDRFNQLLADVAADQPRVEVIDLGGRASPGGQYADVVDGEQIRSAGVHYSAAGAAWAVRWLLPQIIPLIGDQPR